MTTEPLILAAVSGNMFLSAFSSPGTLFDHTENTAQHAVTSPGVGGRYAYPQAALGPWGVPCLPSGVITNDFTAQDMGAK